jgi:maltose alpha-D-glucosyltransferase/alpha-amylase
MQCWPPGDHEWLLAFVDTASTPPEPSAHWWVPLSLAWEDGDEQRHRQLAPAALAKVRLQARVGVMADALADAAFGHALVQAVAAGSVLPLRGAGAAGLGRKIGKSTRPAKSTTGGHGALHGVPSARFAAIAGPATARPVAAAQIAGTQDTTPPRALATRHSTVARVGERLFLKLLRQVQPGPSAEVEMGQFPAGRGLRTLRRAGGQRGTGGRRRQPQHAGAAARLGAQPGQRLDAGGAAPGART